MSSLEWKPLLLGERHVNFVTFIIFLYSFYFYFQSFTFYLCSWSERTLKSKHPRKLIPFLQATNFPDSHIMSSRSNSSKQNAANNPGRRPNQGQMVQGKGKGKGPARNPPRQAKRGSKKTLVPSGGISAWDMSSNSRGKGPGNSELVSNSMAWLSMMLDPGNAPIVRSPSQISQLGSICRIPKAFDIAYGDTTDGYFTVIARPSLLDPIIVAKSPQRWPNVGSADLVGSTLGKTLVFKHGAADPGYPDDGNMMWNIVSTKQVATIQPLADSTLTTHNAFPCNPVASVITCTVVSKSDQHRHLRLRGRVAGGAWTWVGNVTAVAPSGTAVLYSANPGINLDALIIVMTDAASVPSNPAADENAISFNLTFNGYIASTALPGSISSFVTPDLVDIAKLNNCRVTAMSMLVTNTGPPVNAGGEVVMASTRQETVYSGKSTADLMNLLRVLSEQNRIHSGNVVDGGYSVYIPDDLSSYEPKEYSDRNFFDNCVVAAGKMTAGGQVRVIINYIIEFYTPVVYFDKRTGPVWDPKFQSALRLLKILQISSANDDHETMIATQASFSTLGLLP